MGRIDRSTKWQPLYAFMSQRNLERQFSLLTDMVHVGLQLPLLKLNSHIICALHSTATVHLVDEPGRYRTDNAHITGSAHTPCDPNEINRLMVELIAKVHQDWKSENTFNLAAYVLWRLVWIHPFEDGNGRTARALSYLIICLKEKTLLFGSKSYLSIIRDSFAQEYMDKIRHADRTFAEGKLDILPLAEFLAEIVKLQLQSLPET
jgi:Fic family protein